MLPDSSSFGYRRTVTIPTLIVDVVGHRHHALLCQDGALPPENPLDPMPLSCGEWMRKIPCLSERPVLPMSNLPMTDPRSSPGERILFGMHMTVWQAESDERMNLVYESACHKKILKLSAVQPLF